MARFGFKDKTRYSQESVFTGGFLEAAASAALQREDPNSSLVEQKDIVTSDTIDRYLADAMSMLGAADTVKTHMDKSASDADMRAYSILVTTQIATANSIYGSDSPDEISLENFSTEKTDILKDILVLESIGGQLMDRYASAQSWVVDSTINKLRYSCDKIMMAKDAIMRRFMSGYGISRHIQPKKESFSVVFGSKTGSDINSNPLDILEQRYRLYSLVAVRDFLNEYDSIISDIYTETTRLGPFGDRVAEGKITSLITKLGNLCYQAEIETKRIESDVGVPCIVPTLYRDDENRVFSILDSDKEVNIPELFSKLEKIGTTLSLMTYIGFYVKVLKFIPADQIQKVTEYIKSAQPSNIASRYIALNYRFMFDFYEYVKYSMPDA